MISKLAFYMNSNILKYNYPNNYSMNKPSSFSTICTSNCAFELVGLLLSLSIYHPNAIIYIMCDSKTKNTICTMTPNPRLTMKWFVELDEYDGMNRATMDKLGIWSNFQMSKANVISRALEIETDTLFLDSDIIITGIINDIDITKELGVSPQYIQKYHIDKTGIYNGGMLWTKNKDVSMDWIKYTKTSRYYDQASIEDLVKSYDHFEFGENYNLQCWRYYLSDEPKEIIASHISSESMCLCYKHKPLKFIHTHFLDKRFHEFNHLIIQHMQRAKMYKILAIIYRVIHNKWILKIPKQPLNGMGFHVNDSFRELPIMMKLQNKDVDVVYHEDSIHCWIEPSILLYDRPTLEWCNNDIFKSSLFLMGNGSVEVEGKTLQEKLPEHPIKPWIFWPRKPMLLEKLLSKYGVEDYINRNIESIFIGNIENNVQNRFRCDSSWGEVLSEYHCTQGNKHLFTHEEYLLKLRSAKYGLCLRGYGSKCHREVELMAFGTVPIITKNVNVTSYMEPLIENVHYLFAHSPDELKNKIQVTTPQQWEVMSTNCYEWYQRNVHSNNCWNNMITNIIYY